MNITEHLKNEIIIHCQIEYPKEACGFILEVDGQDTWVPCKNIDQDPNNYFTISSKDYIKAEATGKIKAIVHSHTLHPTVFSTTDIAMQKRNGIPWLLVGLQKGEPEFQWLTSNSSSTPLYGRKYEWAVNDCYSFVRDYYKETLSITIPDYERIDRFWEKGLDLYRQYFTEAGFVEVEGGVASLQEHDVCLINLGGTPIPSHGAIYLGGNTIGHHLLNRLSCKEVYGRFYQSRTVMVLRHKDLT